MIGDGDRQSVAESRCRLLESYTVLVRVGPGQRRRNEVGVEFSRTTRTVTAFEAADA